MSLSRISGRLLSLSGVWLTVWLSQGADLPAHAEQAAEAYQYNPAGKRDPFLSPFSGPLEEEIPEEAKTPLQRFDLGQLKLVGIIWEADEPKALIEDGGGLGYIVTRGTLIGSKGGVIRAIEPKRIVVEEYETDFSGKRRPQERELLLSIIEAGRESSKKKSK
ncbi:MAG: pilus assembly protein PilP [Thermodesulfobacteriota bacterium]|jgi:type IV pilus assembly protein PilP